MLTTGLLSITFRKLSAQRIIDLARTANLSSIEWGGDVHVPHGNLKTASLVQQMTIDAGLSISAYGSYYRLGGIDSPAFESVLETAQALRTSLIRVWAGRQGSAAVDKSYRELVVADARQIVEMAQAVDIRIGLEYHENTLTDTLESTMLLLQEVNNNNLLTFWQPPHTSDLKAKCHGLQTLLPHLANVHVFHWNPNNKARYPLSDGSSNWQNYLEIIESSPRDHVLSLEFVKNDDEEQFVQDATTLRGWLTSS